MIVDGARRLLHIAEAPLDHGGTVGAARDVTEMEEARRQLGQHIAAHAEVIGSLSTAIAIFGPDKQLEFANDAYAKMFDFDPGWLHNKPLFREIIEHLRTNRRLPEVPDFAVYRAKREAMFTELIEPGDGS